jgi:hypothetical protein
MTSRYIVTIINGKKTFTHEFDSISDLFKCNPIAEIPVIGEYRFETAESLAKNLTADNSYCFQWEMCTAYPHGLKSYFKHVNQLIKEYSEAADAAVLNYVSVSEPNPIGKVIESFTEFPNNMVSEEIFLGQYQGKRKATQFDLDDEPHKRNRQHSISKPCRLTEAISRFCWV